MNVLLAHSTTGSKGIRRSLSFRKYVTSKRYYFVLKRGMDIILSIVLIVGVLSWLTPLLALLLRLDSRGPVFFLQKRVGRGGRSFVCYKFRTMLVNEEADSKRSEPGDPRITRTGKWMRQLNIDELPQLLNVLCGQMSLVGPRPHMHADCRQFAAMIPRYKLRSLVKPGMTGMAQVKGYHGPVGDHAAAMLRYQWDIYYVRNASVWLDLRILLGTLIRISNSRQEPAVRNTLPETSMS